MAGAGVDHGVNSEARFAALYGELHRIARREVSRRRGYATIGATTLLHEAYLDVSEHDAAHFPDDARFLAYAAKVMRGIVIDHVRQRTAQKRGGGYDFTVLDTATAAATSDGRTLEQIGDTLDDLAEAEPPLARIVDLKFFCGFSFAEIAAMQGTSERTVQRQWEKARAYLRRALAAPDFATNAPTPVPVS